MHTIEWLNNFIWYIVGILTSATTPGPSGPRSKSNERVLHITKTGASPSDGLGYSPGRLLGEGVLTLCRNAVGVFFSPSQLGCRSLSGRRIKGVDSTLSRAAELETHCLMLFSFIPRTPFLGRGVLLLYRKYIWLILSPTDRALMNYSHNNVSSLRQQSSTSIFFRGIKETWKILCQVCWTVGLVWFYGISTIVGYLAPNPVYTYELYIYD